jgi:hypothetical protein
VAVVVLAEVLVVAVTLGAEVREVVGDADCHGSANSILTDQMNYG